MAENIRNDIMGRVGARLAAVTGFTATGKVAEWRTNPFALPDLPVISYQDGADEVEAPAYGEIRHNLAVTVEIIVEGAGATEETRGYLQDVVTAIGTDPTWETAAGTALAETTKLTGVEVVTASTDRLFSVGKIDMTIIYTTALWAV